MGPPAVATNDLAPADPGWTLSGRWLPDGKPSKWGPTSKPCIPAVDLSLEGTVNVMLTVSPWFTVKGVGETVNEYPLLLVTAVAVMVNDCVAVGTTENGGCGITGPCDESAATMAR